MARIIFFLFCFYFTCPINGFAQKILSDQNLFDKTTLLIHTKNLSSDAFEGRRTGTKGAIKARKYIINAFHKLNIKPLGRTFEQPFLFSKNNKEYNGVNVLGVIKGTCQPNKYVVISAHYDHEGIKNGRIYNGADDNASGVCALFSLAEFIKAHPPKHSIILAAFDGEELGLQGSKYFVNNTIVPFKNIVFNINIDMIGRSDEKELYVVGTNSHSNFKHLVPKNKSTCKSIRFLKGHDGYDGKDNWLHASDHASFYKKGIPFLYFGVEDHEDYHEPTDDFENLQPEFYCNAVSQIITVFKKIDLMSF